MIRITVTGPAYQTSLMNTSAQGVAESVDRVAIDGCQEKQLNSLPPPLAATPPGREVHEKNPAATNYAAPRQASSTAVA
jgi:hypothetical protein